MPCFLPAFSALDLRLFFAPFNNDDSKHENQDHDLGDDHPPNYPHGSRARSYSLKNNRASSYSLKNQKDRDEDENNDLDPEFFIHDALLKGCNSPWLSVPVFRRVWLCKILKLR